jgi:hypothetical protein
VSAVRLVTVALPAEMNPASDLTGPENVDFAILSLLNKFYRLGESARAVDRLILSLERKGEYISFQLPSSY